MSRPFYLIPDDGIEPVIVGDGYECYMLSDLMDGSAFSATGMSIEADNSFLMPMNPHRNLLLKLEVTCPGASSPHVFRISPVCLCDDFGKGWDACGISFDDVLLKCSFYDSSDSRILNIVWVSLYRDGKEVFSLL